MLKHRPTLGRSRTTPRHHWHPPAVLNTTASQLAAARRVAQTFVAERWPELGQVQPHVTAPLRHCPSPALLERLGVAPHELAHRPDEATYTFTFARDAAAPSAAPLVATITVDNHQHIVKALISK